MLTCGSCTDKDCPDTGTSHTACDVFTQEDIEEEPVIVTPTLEQYRELLGKYDKRGDEIARLETRLSGYYRTVAELVRFAQGDEAP